MAIIVVGKEKNFAALRPRLFAGKVSNKTAGEVASEVREANPHANLDKLTPGTVLTVPDSPRVRVRGDLSLDETTKNAIIGLANAGKGHLDEIVSTAESREAEEAKERKEVLKALDSIPGGQTGRARDKALTTDLANARKALAEEDARASERTATVQKAQGEWTEQLEQLKGLLD
jgi:ABC-type Na+ efflux pump permease subunit